MGIDGNVSFYGNLDPVNGYLRLLPDGTGTLSYNGTEASLTWDPFCVYWNGHSIPYSYETYFDSELDRDESMLVLYLMDENTSIVFRPAEEPAS